MKYKVAIIGLGKIGSAYDEGQLSIAPRSHVGAVLQIKKFQLTAVCDLSSKSRSIFKKHWDEKCPIYSSVDDLLKHGPYDVVVLATPTENHKASLEKIIACKPALILCEKPFCKNFREAAAIQKMAEVAGIPILVNYHRRWDSRFKKLEKLFSKYGKPERVVVTYRKGLLNYGSHAIDFLLRFLGPIEKVIQQNNLSNPSTNPIDPSFSFALKFFNGTLAHFIGIDEAEYELFNFEFYFQRYKIQIIFGGQEVHVFKAKKNSLYRGYTNLVSQEFQWTQGLGPQGLLPVYQEIAEILSKNIKSSHFTSSSKNALEVHRVIQSVASKNGKEK